MRVQLLILMACLGLLAATARAEDPHDGENASLLAAARAVDIYGETSVPDLGWSPPAVDRAASWWERVWAEHRLHFATVFAVEEAEHIYSSRIGPSRRPLLFGNPPGIDVATYHGTQEEGESQTFVARHKSSLIKLISVGAIAATNGSRWDDSARDLLGFVEAWKFNAATTSLVKMVVGRQRPALELTDPDSVTPDEYERIQNRSGGRLSFYSAATSSAFTAMSYADRVVARRLAARPWARRLAFMGLYGFAGYVGYSRLRDGEHYLTDVLAGAAAGTLAGRSWYRVHHDTRGELADRRRPEVRWSPPAPLPGGGVQAGMTIEF